ncbi:hypothetical protein [Acetobacter cerevisiae]|uniref:Uncharacterized protein n=1 Tax=Acetobacter cerevisiae TaxID=178900 RepID=A0A149V7U5_9PROT|nr:hypothetical protein [Acetobacter cerevisiae]KXV76003.1 hypothetical protein AD954_13655 [Acetobacter cerevisiae]
MIDPIGYLFAGYPQIANIDRRASIKIGTVAYDGQAQDIQIKVLSRYQAGSGRSAAALRGQASSCCRQALTKENFAADILQAV